MMTDTYLQQVARLSALLGFPTYSQGIAELARALRESTRAEAHAAAVIDEIVGAARYSPTPADIRRVAHEVLPRFAGPGGAKCGRCDEGWLYHQYLVTWRPGGGRTSELLTDEQAAALAPKVAESGTQMVYGAVTYCSCPAGQRRREFAARRPA